MKIQKIVYSMHIIMIMIMPLAFIGDDIYYIGDN